MKTHWLSATEDNFTGALTEGTCELKACCTGLYTLTHKQDSPVPAKKSQDIPTRRRNVLQEHCSEFEIAPFWGTEGCGQWWEVGSKEGGLLAIFIVVRFVRSIGS